MFVGSGASRLLEGFWVCGELVLGVEAGGLPCLGLGACLSRGLWSSPEWEKAAVGIAREAGAVCVRAGIEG